MIFDPQNAFDFSIEIPGFVPNLMGLWTFLGFLGTLQLFGYFFVDRVAKTKRWPGFTEVEAL